MPPLLRLFGTPALVIDEVPVRLAVPAKALALLGLIAAEPGKALERASLAAALYPDETDAQARTNARRQLHLLAKALPSNAFILTKNTVRLNDAIVTDVARFLREDSAQAAALRTAEYCAGIFDDALARVRDALDRRYAALLRRLLDEALQHGDAPEAIRRLEQLISGDPLDEKSVRVLMDLRYAQGDRSGALRDYSALAACLRSEVDAEPERETVALFQRILYAGDAGAAPHNLVASATSFVGREAELDALSAALRTDRLNTIAGPPGIGKTRLARRAAFHHLREFRDGVWFVDLAPVKNAAQLHDQVRSILQVQRAPSSDEASAICDALRGKRVLLILDNCEHVIEPVREIVGRILQETPCTVMTTSRRRLGIHGERVIALEPLETPGAAQSRAEDVKRSAAGRLFVERAVAVAPSLRVTDENAPAIAAMVRRLDGIPLAIEIVAARANLLTMDGMLKRLSESIPPGPLRGTDARYATVDAAIAWSYDLLSTVERRLFDSLAVFEGGSTLEAVEHVCAGQAPDVFAALSELVESSLLRAEPLEDDVRYSMYEMTRAFALEHFARQADAGDVRQRHARYYASLAEHYSPHFKTEREVEFYRRCDRDYANFRAAMSLSADSDPVLAARLVTALWRYLIFTWRMADADTLLERIFQRAGEVSPAALAQVHLAAGMFAKERMNGESAARHLQRALELFRTHHDTRGEIDAIYALSLITFNHGDAEAARRLCEECLALQQAAGDIAGAAATTANLGAVAQMLDDDERAIELFDRALTGFRATNNERGIAFAYRALSLSYETLDRFEEAVAAAQQSVTYYDRLGEQSRLADGLVMLGNVLANVGRLRESLEAFIRAFEALQSARHTLFAALALLGYANTAQLCGEHIEAVRAASKGRDLAQAAELKLEPKYAAFVDALLARARAALGKQQYDAAWTAGRRADIEDFASNARRMRERLTS